MFLKTRSRNLPPAERVIVGLGVFAHDASVAIVQQGRLVFAAEEERFNRRKHTREFPVGALTAGLAQTGIPAGAITDVVVNFSTPAMFRGYLKLIGRYLPRSLRLLFDVNRYRNASLVGTYQQVFCRQFGLDREAINWVEVPHHLCHAASAYYQSPFEHAALLTSDALGEFDAVLLGQAQGNRLELLRQIDYPHSMGALYSAVTDHLGFKMFSGEGTVMGLSAFGNPRRYDFAPLLELLPDGDFRLDERYITYHIAPWAHENWVSPKFTRRFGPRRAQGEPINDRHAALARALQDTADHVLLHLCRGLQQRTKETNLCYAGGVALNGYGNTRILSETGFSDLSIPPAANDGGTAIGAALFHAHHTLGLPRRLAEPDPYLGPAFTSADCRRALDDAALPFSRPADLLDRAARALAANQVVGWFEGRMEIGPRALGHRSILANPGDAGMKDHLNRRVKHREPFRPFAPMVPEEEAARFFEMPAAKSPYMLLIMNVRPEWRERLPAITHVDGTARVQTVDRAREPRLWELLRAVERQTGVPVLLNTSFNGPGEPIVCSPAEAIATFQRHGLDALVLEDCWAEKGGQP